MSALPAVEMTPHPLSFADPNGRLFRWKDQLYRGITARRADLYRELLTTGALREVFDRQLLIKTEIATARIGDYPLVLKHRHLLFATYAFEWSAAMLKDAAYMVLELESELAKRGLTLQDAHPWNVLFDGSKP